MSKWTCPSCGDVLEAMDRPWFDFREGGEDYFFCRKVRQMGHKILVDTALLAGHLRELSPATYWHWLDGGRAEYEKEHGEESPSDEPDSSAQALPE